MLAPLLPSSSVKTLTDSLKFYLKCTIKEVVVLRQRRLPSEKLTIVGTFDCITRDGVSRDRCLVLVAAVEEAMRRNRTSPQVSTGEDSSGFSIFRFILEDLAVFVNCSDDYVSILVLEADHNINLIPEWDVRRSGTIF